MQPFFLKTFHIFPHVSGQRANPFQNKAAENVFPDVVRRAIAPSAFVLRADVPILLSFAFLTGTEVQLASAVCAEDQAGKESFLCFLANWAMLDLPQLLYPFPLFL